MFFSVNMAPEHQLTTTMECLFSYKYYLSNKSAIFFYYSSIALAILQLKNHQNEAEN